MVINFRTRETSRGTRKLAQTFTLKKKIKKINHRLGGTELTNINGYRRLF
jgi:hypothetical protein